MTAHSAILTEEQMSYAILTSAAFADELAPPETKDDAGPEADPLNGEASGEPSETGEASGSGEPSETGGASGSGEPSEPSEPSEPGDAEQASDATEPAPTATTVPALCCAVCRKTYRYKKAYETHLATSGHGQGPQKAVAPVAPADPDQDFKAQIELVAHLLDPFKGRELLMEELPPIAEDKKRIVAPHISQDLGMQLAAAKTYAPVGIPQLNKAADILFHNYILTNQVRLNLQRRKVIDAMHARGPVKEGQCFICRQHFSKERFFKHTAECSKMKSITCEYCEQTFKNSSAKSRHIPTCAVLRMCEDLTNGTDDAPDPSKLRKAQDFGFALIADSVTNPDAQNISMLGGYSLSKFKKWMKQNK